MTDSWLTLERALLLLVVFGFVGLLPELLLLGHFDEPTQFIPLALIVLAVASVLWFAAAPAGPARRTFVAIMWLVIVSGPVGIILHLKGNLEFEREMDASASGWPLFAEVMSGATPVLAPGTMTLLGLLGLVYVKAVDSAAR